ncbi:MAG: SMC-Scp complex subunit ScpB [Planctomycetes bacterium]|nr:SMC-Scp complex subunit ScpB [Planctomycetota bacterium]
MHDSALAARYNAEAMDEISREQPLDTTAADAPVSRGKGPDELRSFERGQVDGDLVVTARPGDGEPRPEGPAARFPAPVERAPEEPPAVIDPAAAAAALAAEAEAVEIDATEDLDAEELPAVPELQDAAAVARIVFVLMLTSREGLSLFRLAQACNTTQKLVEQALGLLQADLRGDGEGKLCLPVELARTGDVVKWLSGAEAFPYLQRLRGVKKLEKLSPAALETLAVIAYRQPVMRSEIEAIRGVKAGPMLRTLLHHRLVKVTGRADVPGRPLQYGTTQQFLERFGLQSLQELPSLKEWKNLG